MKSLKLSQFSVNVPHDGDFLLYNTLSRALIRIDQQGLDALQQAPDSLPQNTVEALKKQGFLVPADLHEGERYRDYLARAGAQGASELSVTLLVAYGCPLACGYCYQGGTHTGGYLKGAQTEKVINFLKKECEERQVKHLYISFYGGEPLLNPKAITEVATEMQAYCREQEIKFLFGMVTSGVMLTREQVEELLPLGFVNAQVTIDGDQETHDASRPLKSGKGTYNPIMKNLEEYAGLIHTDILSVVDESRIEATYGLIETLAAKGLAKRRVRMKFSPVSPTYDDDTLSGPIDPFQIQKTENDMALVIAKLAIYAQKHGLVDDLRPQKAWCAMQRHSASHFTLGIDGKIHTCPTLIGRNEEYGAGDIDSGIGGIHTVMTEEYERANQCLECQYLPICADCRVDALYMKGDIMAANTHEERYDLIVPELVRGHYRAIQERSAT